MYKQCILIIIYKEISMSHVFWMFMKCMLPLKYNTQTLDKIINKIINLNNKP